jgi:hypothetical protein
MTSKAFSSENIFKLKQRLFPKYNGKTEPKVLLHVVCGKKEDYSINSLDKGPEYP